MPFALGAGLGILLYFILFLVLIVVFAWEIVDTLFGTLFIWLVTKKMGYSKSIFFALKTKILMSVVFFASLFLGYYLIYVEFNHVLAFDVGSTNPAYWPLMLFNLISLVINTVIIYVFSGKYFISHFYGLEGKKLFLLLGCLLILESILLIAFLYVTDLLGYVLGLRAFL